MGWFSGSGPSEEPKQAVEVKAPSSIESAKGLIPSFNFGNGSTSSTSTSTSTSTPAAKAPPAASWSSSSSTSWFSSSPKEPVKPVDSGPSTVAAYFDKTVDGVKKGASSISIPEDPFVLGIACALGGVGLGAGGLLGYRRYWRRIKNVNDVTNKMLDGRRWVRGIVTSVGDGDNFRLYHTPGPFWKSPAKIRRVPSTAKELRDQTLHIRISGVDAPENAHFGNPSQPHAKESLDWLRSTIMGKTMTCELLRKDQYSRIVAVPYIYRRLWWNKPLPVLMLKEGMAVVYESAGAEYGPWGLEGLKQVEATARKSRKGLWAAKKLELPGDYKKRMKIVEGVPVDTVQKKAQKSKGIFGWLKGLMSGK